MAYDEYLADRMRNILKKKTSFEEKKMMGGLCFMVEGKMLAGIVKNELMARIGPDAQTEALSKEGCRQMDFTGRPMKGYVFVDPEVLDSEENLEEWLDLCLAFNPFARSSKKK